MKDIIWVCALLMLCAASALVIISVLHLIIDRKSR